MPLYEYSCPACGHRFELLVSWSRADDQGCPSCGEPARRLVSAFASSVNCEASGGG